MDKLADLVTDTADTSTLLLPDRLSLRALHTRARRKVKKRIEKSLAKKNEESILVNDTLAIDDITEENEVNEDVDDNYDKEEEVHDVGLKPHVGEYWQTGNREGNYRYVIVESVQLDFVSVKYFKASYKGSTEHRQEDDTYPPHTICTEDLGKKVSPPRVEKRGKRTFYHFEEEEMA